jgi:hypothetical protein
MYFLSKKLLSTMFVAPLALVIGGAGCAQTDNKTQITVALAAETLIPYELDELSISITDANGVAQTVSYAAGAGLDEFFFPGTAAVIPVNESSFGKPVSIEVRGIKGGKTQVFRRAKIGYVRERNISLAMPLRMACLAVTCPADQTCQGGMCMPDEVDSLKLRDFKATEVIGDTPGACFNETKCLTSSKLVPVTIARTKPAAGLPGPFDYECTFPLVEGSFASAGLDKTANVSIRWEQANKRVIVLDEGDAQEGWVRLGPNRGKLARGICASYADPERDPLKRVVFDRALDVAVSTECTTKTAATPFCTNANDSKNVAGAGVTWATAPAIDLSARKIED